MIKIEKHPHGIAISADGGVDRNKRTKNLELEFGVYRGFVTRGRLIVPIEAASSLLEILGFEGVIWDEAILSSTQLKQDHRESQLKARSEVEQALKAPYIALNDYARVQRLDPHQVEAVAAIVSPSLKGIAIFDEQGTGKTITALAAFDCLRERGKVRRLLVIAPKSVLTAWQVQCAEFLDGRCRVIQLVGSAAIRRRSLLSPHDIVLVNYETAVASEELLRTVVSAQPANYMLVIDESYFVKNPDTARARMARRLRATCERAVILCGTPAPNSSVDIVNQVDIADEGVAFAGRIISKDPEEAYAEVSAALQDVIYLRRLKEHVLPEIPAKQIEKVYFNLAPRQRALYNQARDTLAIEVSGVDNLYFTRNRGSFLAKRIRLLQICSNPRIIDPLYDEVPSKIRALDRLVKELVEEQGKKIVIWSYFRMSLSGIAERYHRHGVVRIDGTVVNIEDRLKAIELFQRDPDTRIFVGNAAAAGAGITLTAAHHAIYESFSNQAAHYLQSIDRIHRRGQTDTAVSHVLIARNTIEEHEYGNLVRKEHEGRELLGDHYREPMTRERFLSELLPTSKSK
jgi:SNF2 family DNA or RNA helicase